MDVSWVTNISASISLPIGGDGNISFMIDEPGGHRVEFVEYKPGSLHSSRFGKMLPETRFSKRIIHVGFTVLDRGMKPQAPPKVRRDGKWQLNLYEPNLTRSELMEFKPAEKTLLL
jgi:hypothetical protein